MTFPNFKGKQNKKELFSPEDFMNYLKKIGAHPKHEPPRGTIFCYNRSLMKHVEENHKVTKVDGFDFGKFYLLDDTDRRVGLIGDFGIGAPVAVTLLEELIAYGVKDFVSVGTAGTLQHNIGIGELVVCDRSIRDEGTSHHYLPPSKYAQASRNLTEKIISLLDRMGETYIVGTSWTTDAPYRETIAEIEQYQREGVATVEMEAAALFAIAQYRGVNLAAMFTISDSLADLRWDPQFHEKKVEMNLETLYTVATRTLLES